jgi:nickel transport protein
MKRKSVLFVFAALFFFSVFAEKALAHRVNVFAFVDGDEIQVECGFSKSNKVKSGKLVITDLETEAVVLEGVTNEEGVFRFRPSDVFLATGHGLAIRLIAGEGHQNDWTISAEELRGLSRNASAAVPPQGQPGQQTGAAGVDAAALEAAIGKMLDEKLSPIRQELARQREEQTPGLRDIAGGIGWILGLLGLATYMKYKR